MPPQPPTPAQTADKLLLQWAAKKAASENRNVADVLREEGILNRRMLKDIEEREIPLSKFNRYREGREEMND